MSTSTRPTVFLSYSHQDRKSLGELRTMLAPLVHDSLIDVWWDGDIKPSEKWREEIDKALASARIGVLLVSPNFLASDFIRQNELPYLIEAARDRGVTLFWVLLSPCLYEHTPLAEIQAAHDIARPLDVLGKAKRQAVLKAIGQMIAGAAKASPQSGEGEKAPNGALPRLDLGRLPIAGPLLIGRETELARLDVAWADPGTHVLTFVAFGGMGKSTLLGHWLDRMSSEDWRGARRVLDWSFYSQGNEERATYADRFFDHALAWFGDPDPKTGAARDRGLRLASLVREEKTLLILDGIEPLQHPPSSPLAGWLKDPALSALLRALARANSGLCVVTTREPIADFDPFSPAAPQENLEALSPEAGAELLKQLGVKGKDSDLLATSWEFGNHALTLSLLGGYLSRAANGDVRRRKEVNLAGASERKGDHALRVIGTYAHWLGEGSELAALRLLGLFNRPAQPKALEALRVKPAIPGLTEPLIDLGEQEWQSALSSLREHGLLLLADPDRPETLDTLDAHPLIRAFFQEELEKQRPEAWQAGNLRLFEYFQKEAPDLPDTLETMEPLFSAVIHGCRAGRFREAFSDVYLRRIQRGNELFITRRLGAFGSDLSAISGFFARHWDQPVADLSSEQQAFVLNEAGSCLRSLGRLGEAIRPLESALKIDMQRADWKNASAEASNLSELFLTLGNVQSAVAFGKQSVDLADESDDSLWLVGSRGTLADALHQLGRWEESAKIFRKAEAFQEKRRKSNSVLAYRHCSLMLSRSEPDDGSALDCLSADTEAAFRVRQACWKVRDQAELALKKVTAAGKDILSIALNHLTLGRTHLRLAVTSPDSLKAEAEFTKAAEYLGESVKRLRQAGSEEFIALGLLARAALRRLRGDLPAAEADLSEALEIAERGSMRLHECDAHLEWARFCRQRWDRDGLKQHVARARQIVEETGYGRRRREVEWLERQISA